MGSLSLEKMCWKLIPMLRKAWIGASMPEQSVATVREEEEEDWVFVGVAFGL